MKKRILSLASLLLVLCIFLCSCSAITSSSPRFLSLLKQRAESSVHNAQDLKEENIRLIKNGEACYDLISPTTFSQNIKNEINILKNAILEKTGVELKVRTNKRAGNIITPKLLNSAEMKTMGIDYSEFRIFFNETNDLMIVACNEIMLAEAMHYFADHYVNAKTARADIGYLSLPEELNYTSGKMAVIGEDSEVNFVVVRPEKASARVLEAANKLAASIKSRTGKTVEVKSDFRLGTETSSEKREILVGLCNREGVADAAANLSPISYLLNVTESDIRLLGTNDSSVEEAVDAFISNFVKGGGGAAVKKPLYFPTAVNFAPLATAIEIARDGKCSYSLIYPASIETEELEAVRKFAETFEKMVGASLTLSSDASSVEAGEFEFVYGSTNRGINELLKENAWSIETSESSILINGGSDVARTRALSELLTTFSSLIWEQNGIPVGDILTDGEEKLLCIYPNTKLSGTVIPKFPDMTGPVDIGDGSLMYYQLNATSAIYKNYKKLLASFDLTEYTSRAVGAANVQTATYHDNSYIYNISFNNDDRTVRLIVDSTSISALPPMDYKNASVCEPLFAQLGESLYKTVDCGMSYVVRLTDGTFLVIDGGVGTDEICDDLLDFLKEYNPLGGKPIITSWIFTHAHTDHIGAFRNFSRKYAQNVILQSVCYTFPTEEKTANSDSESVISDLTQFNSYISYFGKDVTTYKIRTGQIYRFANCEIEMLFTYEDHPQPHTLSYFNDTSIVFRIKLSNGLGTTQTFMMLGDASQDSNNILATRYGDYLQSDAVQVAHHGYSGGTKTVYDTIKAAVVFWPCPLENLEGVPRFADPTWSSVTRYMLDQTYSETLYVSCLGDAVLTLPDVAERKIVGIGMEAVKTAVPPES